MRSVISAGSSRIAGGSSSLVLVTGMILFNMLLGELPQIGFVLYAGLAAL